MDLKNILGLNNKNNSSTILIIIAIIVLLFVFGNGSNSAPPVAGLNFGSFNVAGSPYNDVGFVNRYGGENTGSNNNIFFILLILALIFLLGNDHED